MDMKKNKAQEDVIHTTEGQLIVIACPGSGKTTTLVRRINHMVRDCKIPPEHILMVTFSNAAAKEMRERYQKQFGKDNVTFCTIHSMCLAILRKFAGYTNENLMTDSRTFFYEQLRKYKQINDKEEFINSLITEISVIKNNQLILEEYHPKCCDDQHLFIELFEAYEAYKKELKLIDFDDMLIFAYKTMKEDKECLEWLRNQYRYIQVDEYQDTNYLQRDIIYLLAGENGNLTVVGDDDQSIYGFRGARPEIMLNFKKNYPDTKEVHLSTNYRSDKGIIQFADALISKNQNRFKKKFLGSKKDLGKVDRVDSITRESQLNRVALKIQELIENGEDPNNIAVLYRTNKQSEGMADLLLTMKIPFYSIEKINSRYEHWLFQDIRSYYNLANGRGKNPKRDLSRVLNHPNRFLLDPEYIKAGPDKDRMRRTAYVTNKIEWKRNNALDAITAFFYALERMEGLNPADMLANMNSFAKYSKYLSEYADYRNIESEELTDLWAKYTEDAKKNNTWNEWGRYIVRYNAAIKNSQKQKDGVVLSTMHSSKGLEWKHVFIIDCVEGTCPFSKAETPAELEEERRLFYVAATRAKENLYLCSYRQKGDKSVKSSPYLVG